MWQQVQVDLPEEIAVKTSSVWLYPGIMQVGLMRESMLAPPVLWGQKIKGGLRNLRKAPGLLDDLQRILYSPIVYAEVETDLCRNQDLLVYLGFTWLGDIGSRRLYQRSI